MMKQADTCNRFLVDMFADHACRVSCEVSLDIPTMADGLHTRDSSMSDAHMFDGFNREV